MKQAAFHHQYMSLALKLAERGRFTASPNPMVGCVIVKNNHIIGQGWHQRAGGPHAEIIALQQAKDAAKGATLYVTLEPCCHFGRTGPCTSELISAGIKEIYVACLDSNPLVSGRGIQQLQDAGISVKVGLYEKESKRLNEKFFHYMKYKRPFVIAKWAMSLDGMTVTNLSDTRQISGSGAQCHTHQLRQSVDSILIGANTAIQDNPQLTVRLGLNNQNPEIIKQQSIRQPLRIVLSSRGSLPLNLKIFDPTLPGKTLVVTTNAVDKTWYNTISKTIETCVIAKNDQGQVDLPSLLDELGKREITSVLVEGGMTVHKRFFQDNLVNKIQMYLSPVIIGSLAKKQRVSEFDLCRVENDFCLTADYQDAENV